MGKVIIVTASRDNWVEKCAESHLDDECINILKNLDIYYVDKFLNNDSILIENRKTEVIKYILDQNLNYINVISLGDGNQEYNAYIYLKNIQEIYYKHIRFIVKPTIKQLALEYSMILKNINDIYNLNTSKLYELRPFHIDNSVYLKKINVLIPNYSNNVLLSF
jgi:hypothetical protein